MKHILWDWNGTLLDDTLACVDTLNIMLGRRGLKPVSYEFFRDNFSFPARGFYDRIGMKVSDSEWDALASEYFQTYLQQPVALNESAVEVLNYVASRGWRQSIISALRQDFLIEDVRRHGLFSYFDHIFGSDNLDGASKVDRAKALLTELRADGKGAEPQEFVLIGDSLHDKEVADAIGVECILVASGSHSRSRLAASATAISRLSDLMSLW